MGKRSNTRNNAKPRKRNKRAKAAMKWMKIKKEEQMKAVMQDKSPPRDVLAPRVSEMSPQPGTSGIQSKYMATPCQSSQSSSSHGSERHSESEYDPSLPSVSKRGEFEMQEEPRDLSDDDIPELVIAADKDPKKTLDEVIPGRRIVNIAHLLKELTALSSHGLKCTYGRYDCISERRSGIFSELVYRCNVCNSQKSITTEAITKEEAINNGFVWGSLSVLSLIMF